MKTTIARRFVLTGLALTCLLAFGAASASAELQTTYQRQLTGFGRLGADSVAVDGLNGDVLVADSGSGVIQVFNSAGTHLATWNGSNVPGIGSFGGAGVAVAANDATGDVYVVDETDRVVDVFNAEGGFLATWNGANTPARSFTSLDAVAVDQANGDVYVAPRSPAGAVIDVFDASGKYLSQISGAGTLGGSFASGGSGFSVAVNGATGDVLVAEGSAQQNDNFDQPAIYEFGATGEYLATWYGYNTPAGYFGVFGTDVAVSEAGGDVLVAGGAGSVVDVFTSGGEYLSQFTGAETPGGSFQPQGVAVDPASGEVYVSSQEGERPAVVDVFAAAPVPDVVAAAPTIAPPGGATLNGTVDPNGSKVSECRFEYGSEAGSYTNTVECAQTAVIGEGHSAVPVSATVSGLQPDALYHFHLVAANAKGVSMGRDATFLESTAPVIEGESSSGVGSGEASLSVQIDAAGLPTSYRVEYGPSAGYGFSTLEVSLGDPASASGAIVHLTGLRPETEYHFRFIATNSFGTTLGGDETFTTTMAAAAVSSALPDGRVYELVSPPSTEEREVYVPITYKQEPSETETFTQRPMQAANDGGAIVYVAEPSLGGSGDIGRKLGNEYLATRSPSGGWTATDITPAGARLALGVYTSFTAGLSTATLYDLGEYPLVAGLSIPPGCLAIYSRSLSDGAYGAFQPLFTSVPEGVGAEKEGHCGTLQFAGASADGSHLFFETPTGLIAGAPGPGEVDLYEWVAGQLRLVNLLPDRSPAGDAKFGSPGAILLSRVVSADGSRVFWTDRKDGDVYVREGNGTPAAKTALVTEGGEYQTASADGSLAFFTKSGDLYEFDVSSERTSDLAPGGQVQGVVGASEDGSHVYFVGRGVLRGAGGEALRNDRGQEPVAGEENLYLSHDGATAFIATLAGSDTRDWSSAEVWTEGYSSAEAPDVAYTAQVTPDGQSVVFMSSRSLTSYDSHGAGEVYVYDAQDGRLSCASCAPNGAPPTAGGGFLSHPTDNTRLPRWINEEGDEVFFETAEALVPQDSNGKVDVYEWEREGTGGCARSGGCVYLLSGGVSGYDSWFIDADAKGENMFFATRAQLVAADQNDNVDLYDARANGHPPVSPPACTGTGCQGVPPAGPIFATPASATFNGVGNYPPAPSPRSVARKAGGKCAGAGARGRGRCVKRRRHTRRARRTGAKRAGAHSHGKRRSS